MRNTFQSIQWINERKESHKEELRLAERASPVSPLVVKLDNYEKKENLVVSTIYRPLRCCTFAI